MTPSYRMPSRRSVANAARRRAWRQPFDSHQTRLRMFFLDPRDHIGGERIIMEDRYEGSALAVLGMVIDALGLGGGVALDDGANIGNRAYWFGSRFSHVVCVEPGKADSMLLEANPLADKAHNTTIVRCALGDHRGVYR